MFWSDYLLSMRKHSRQANLFFIVVCQCEEGVSDGSCSGPPERENLSALDLVEWEGEVEEEERKREREEDQTDRAVLVD